MIEKLERELAFFARRLEAVHRKRGYPLERAHYLLLLQLREGPASVTDLAHHLDLDDSTVTRQIAAMQRRRLIRRVKNPADGRSTLIERTRLGAESAETMRLARLGRIETLFGAWKQADREKFAQMLAHVNFALSDSLKELAEDHPTPPPQPTRPARQRKAKPRKE
ncbi:DNA-binding MarR family transcriptional regulator [Rhodopseudomonas julia]|uniref:DNA-binding MarR family transcriptional regulator n=1 Tax=Rhodopseudomonas julia TaxID=200617 RepID=A0ABU0C913_9BRAD|nr:MarR family transcriptional regulator [Rhodopseudomonas julia]MDQ0327014.1 DNA-binding MarR family transcriptional regulator [Rhodopseudomonas julia]